MMAVSTDDQLLLLALDEVEDDFHKGDQAVHQMPLVVLLQMSSMVMSTIHLEAHEGLDVPDVEEEEMRWSTVMLSIPVKMKLLVMMDGWSLLLPGGGGGLMVRRRAELCYHVKFSVVFWIFSSRMAQMGRCVVSSHDVILVFMITVTSCRCHCP